MDGEIKLGKTLRVTIKWSVYDITFGFLELFSTPEQITKEYVRHVTESFAKMFDNGYLYHHIASYIVDSFNNRIQPDFAQFTKPYTQRDRNLIKQNIYYLNASLKLLPNLGTSGYDPNLCKIVTTVEETESWIEYPASYNIDDLREYLISKDMIDRVQYNDKRINGLLEHQLKQSGLDKTITMIDCAFNDYLENYKQFQLETLDKLSQRGHETLQRYKGYLSEIGGDCIEPKRRVLHRRSRT